MPSDTLNTIPDVPAAPGLVVDAAPAAEMWVRDTDFGVESNHVAVGDRLLDLRTPGARYADLFLPLHGAHQGDNAACALAAVEALDFGVGTPFGFVHGEADEIRAVRRHLLQERGLTRRDLSCSPYWRRTMTDEAWRRIKRDYVAAMEADAVA